MIGSDGDFIEKPTSGLVDSFKRDARLRSDSIFTRRAKNVAPLLITCFQRFMEDTLTEEEQDFFGKIKKNHTCTITLLDEWKIMRDYNNGIRSDKIRKLYGITEDMLSRLRRVYHVKPYAFHIPIETKSEPVLLVGKISGKSIRIYNKTLWDFLRKNGQFYMHFLGVNDKSTPGINVRIDRNPVGTKLNLIKVKKTYGACVWIARFKHKIGAPDGEVNINVHTNDDELKRVLMEINGSLRLEMAQVFLTASIHRRHKNTAVVQVCCRELASALKRENVSSAYVDVRNGYCIIKPVTHQPSVNSHMSYLQNDGDRIRFSIPDPESKIEYVGVLGVGLNLKKLFITNEEYEISKELLYRGYILRCGSYWKAFDIEILEFCDGAVKNAVIQILNCKPTRNSKDYAIADVYSCELFSRTTNHPGIVLLNPEWENVLSRFSGFDVCNNARKSGVHIFFADFSRTCWSKEVVDSLAALLPSPYLSTNKKSRSLSAFSYI